MNQPSSVLSIALFAVCLMTNGIAEVDDAGLAFYREKVYPVLQKNCFKCHGGGDELKGDFRLTSRAGLLHGGHYGSAYDADDPASSVLLEMISYKDADHQMPPKGKLPDEARMVLAHWMEMGAPYDPALEINGTAVERRGFTVTDEDRQWWAYRPVSNAAPPKVTDQEWAENGIDAFVRAQLDREGLKPNPPAAPEVLVRRLYYDLIGLPPTPEEVAAFVSASEKDAEATCRSTVEELLARPQYGEKWARHWLDLVRYAESNGFERDNPKPLIWQYRDYVIDSFNSNKPYDQFVIEQIAGDEIAAPTKESLIATGYHRLMQWDDEPADREQHVYDVLADNVQITSETFLATSLGCARCHDHKADPVSQKDYYAFMAFFRGVTHYKTEGTILNWASPEEKANFEKEQKAKIASLEVARTALTGEIKAIMEKAGLIGAASDEVSAPLIDDARGAGSEWSYTTVKPDDDWRDIAYVNKSWFKGTSGFGAANPPGSVIRTEWKTPEIWMRTSFGLRDLPESLVLDIHHDEDVEVYLNGTRVFEAKGFTMDYKTIVLPKSALDVLQTGRNSVAVYCRQTGGGQYIDLSLRTAVGRTGSVESLLTGPDSKRFIEQVKEAAGRDLVAELRRLDEELANGRKASAGMPVNAVTEAGPVPGPMHIHQRGSAHAQGDVVEPGLPAVLASDGSDPRFLKPEAVRHDGRVTSGRRLELAKWIVDPANPLTARVMVNRLWQHHFGRGIAPSTSDFGHLGEKPTHPELLDWLATQFREVGWDMKAMHRLILLSKTYRMSSEPESGNLEKDPRNLNLWRVDMRRLTAEELRDSILSVSGNLNLKTHGEWVFPPLPPEVLATASRPGAGWPVSKNTEDHFRRSLYIHVKRSLRHQMLADFDQADTDTSCAVRFTTTVPTQALAMLNSAFVNEQAAIFAKRMRESGGDVRAQIAAGLKVALQRPAEPEELDHLTAFYESLQRDAALTPAQALDRVALLTLNLNEFIYLD